MNDRIGAVHHGTGDITIGGPGVGNVYNAPTPAPSPIPAPRTEAPVPADVGVLTVLTEEMRAVVDVLRDASGYRSLPILGGARFHLAEFPALDGPNVRVVATQTLDRGLQSASVAYQRMRKHFAPPVVLLVGIAGGIADDIRIGDVVLADQVIHYDHRRETTDGPRRRGQDQPMSAELRHRLNDFFLHYGNVVRSGAGEPIRVRRGPIGSGNAVVTDAFNEIRRFLLAYNEKTLAVETEAAGVAQAFYEEFGQDNALRGCLCIRGISDLADVAKRDDHHGLAATNAAAVLAALLPFLHDS
jgi:adenosylhomocysteine nucleosidase